VPCSRLPLTLSPRTDFNRTLAHVLDDPLLTRQHWLLHQGHGHDKEIAAADIAHLQWHGQLNGEAAHILCQDTCYKVALCAAHMA